MRTSTGILVGLLLAARVAAAPPPLRAVLIGGGPEPSYNQVAIESNVRWMDALLPSATSRTILFCDGRTDTPIVQFAREVSDAEKVMRMLHGDGGRGHGDDRFLAYRPTVLKKVDGPTTLDGIDAALKGVTGADPLLLYFTGHGSPGRQGYDHNQYDLWRSAGLTPATLAQRISTLPPGAPVTVIMVQCFSGAFGNLLFEGGQPDGALVDRPICGFFAATRERTAAGCTPEVDEAEYHDFTSYFFAGLTGRDRVGRKVPAPDYNRDGRVGMDEAYAYALVADRSIDVPVATSDVFLRRFVPVKDDSEIAEVPWDEIRSAASVSQRTVLDGLCKTLGPRAQTPERFKTALDEFRRRQREGEGDFDLGKETSRKLDAMRQAMAERFPGLKPVRNPTKEDRALYEADFKRGVAFFEKTPDELASALALKAESDAAERKGMDDAVAGARWLRLLRVAKSVVLETRLRKDGDANLIARFDALKKREAGSPFHR